MRVVDTCRCGGTFTCRGRKSEQLDPSLEHYLWLNAHNKEGPGEPGPTHTKRIHHEYPR